jgi:hypothetical protein
MKANRHAPYATFWRSLAWMPVDAVNRKGQRGFPRCPS